RTVRGGEPLAVEVDAVEAVGEHEVDQGADMTGSNLHAAAAAEDRRHERDSCVTDRLDDARVFGPVERHDRWCRGQLVPERQGLVDEVSVVLQRLRGPFLVPVRDPRRHPHASYGAPNYDVRFAPTSAEYGPWPAAFTAATR